MIVVRFAIFSPIIIMQYGYTKQKIVSLKSYLTKTNIMYRPIDTHTHTYAHIEPAKKTTTKNEYWRWSVWSYTWLCERRYNQIFCLLLLSLLCAVIFGNQQSTFGANGIFDRHGRGRRNMEWTNERTYTTTHLLAEYAYYEANRSTVPYSQVFLFFFSLHCCTY